MNNLTTETRSRLTESQRMALISLLADDDPRVFQTVRSKLLSFGHEVGDWLRPHTLSDDPLLRSRAKAIINHLAQQDADNEFLTFCLRQSEDMDLEEAVWLFARTRYPEVNPQAYAALLDGFARDLRERLKQAASPAQVLATLNHFLFKEQRFVGNAQNYYDPDNSYLNRVLDRRTGNPISLCTMYLLIAKRLSLPITGIGLPGHFVCRFQSSVEEIYIDAFNQGHLLTKADCIKFLHTTTQSVQKEHLSPTSHRRILMRMCTNLHQIYKHLGLAEETGRMQRYLVALAR